VAGNSIPNCEIISLLDKKKSNHVVKRLLCSKKKKEKEKKEKKEKNIKYRYIR